MATYRVNSKSVVIVFSKKEVKALFRRGKLHTGVLKSKALLKAEQKIKDALVLHDIPTE